MRQRAREGWCSCSTFASNTALAERLDGLLVRESETCPLWLPASVRHSATATVAGWLGPFRMIPSSAAPDLLAYYSPETRLFPALEQSFTETGQFHPEALYLILDWKAPRARTRHLHRLTNIAGTFDAAARGIGAGLYTATGPEQRLGLLLTKWGFLLPTASAILVVLYPNTFTMYDIRVCNVLGDFSKLGSMKWSTEQWLGYQRYIAAVQAAAPSGLSLRDCDRWLWGQDKRKAMQAELARVPWR